MTATRPLALESCPWLWIAIRLKSLLVSVFFPPNLFPQNRHPLWCLDTDPYCVAVDPYDSDNDLVADKDSLTRLPREN